MNKKIKHSGLIILLSLLVSFGNAQTFTWYKSTEHNIWTQDKITLKKQQSSSKIDLNIDTSDQKGIVFRNWGTCFNELGWDALNILTSNEKDKILELLFSPSGDLRLGMGRFSMNANDYARDWYSADEVNGDFSLVHFNIERDKSTLIPYIKEAMRFNPNMKFWMSPWSPPSWMKINNSYAVRSDAKFNTLSPNSDVALFEGSNTQNNNVFPTRVATNDYLIQDPRYLRAYANYFCKFIDAYKQEGINVSSVMYQNEAYSYTIYPGCAWTTEGTIRFNVDYLAPALKANHPNVSLYLGTINTNRFEIVDEILSDPRMKENIKGIGFQWEGGQILKAVRDKYPSYDYVQTESECGWGSFDWKAAEHTFNLISHYIGNGCTEYTFWNAILADGGYSGWGWKQNALIRVDSKEKKAILTPEYFAVKHYSRFVDPGSVVLNYKDGTDGKPIIAFRTATNNLIVIAGNFSDENQVLSIRLGSKTLEVNLEPHSLNTFASNTDGSRK